MRVLQLPSWYIPQGGQFCLDQSKALESNGIEIHILANVMLPWRKYSVWKYGFGFTKKKDFSDGILTYRYFSRPVPRMQKINAERWIRRTVRLIEQYISIEGAPDIIHCHGSTYAACAAAVIRAKYNIPYVVTEHWSAFSGKSALAHKLLQKKMSYIQKGFSLASHIITVSDEIIPAVQLYNVNHVPVSSISNIIDTDFFTPASVKLKNERFTFIAANCYRPEKGYDILLQAIDILSQKGYDFRLLIAGRDFDNKDFQKDYINNKSKDKIEFLGFLDAVGIRGFLRQADALVIPSRNESQSLAVLEALSTGVPVVSTDVIPVRFVNEHTGYRVPIENPVILAEAMEKMIKTASAFSLEQLNAPVLAFASSNVVAKSIIEIYNKII
jgi:glycosyltransferase involved in cell wall biosynthesis